METSTPRQTASSSHAGATTVADLEGLAHRFEDLPVEALVKEDLLRLGVAFDQSALRRAAGKKPKSYFIFSFDRVPIETMADREDLRAPEEIALEGGPWGLRRTIVSVRINPASPYRIVAAAEGAASDAVLELGGTPLAGVRFPEPPAYYGRTIAEGRPLTEVAPSIEWGYLIYLTVFRRCQYLGLDEECRFCDITAADCPERVEEAEQAAAEVEHDLF